MGDELSEDDNGISSVAAKIDDHVMWCRTQVEGLRRPELHELEVKLMTEANRHCFAQRWEEALYMFARVLAVLESIGSRTAQISHANCVQRMGFCLRCMDEAEATVEMCHEMRSPAFLRPVTSPASSSMLLPAGRPRSSQQQTLGQQPAASSQQSLGRRPRTVPGLQALPRSREGKSGQVESMPGLLASHRPSQQPGRPWTLLGAHELKETMMEKVSMDLSERGCWVRSMAKVSEESTRLMRAQAARDKYRPKLVDASSLACTR